MRFSFTEEQRLMQRSVRELLDRACSVEHVRRAWTSSSGRVPGLWSKLAELGALGVLVPAAQNGLGLSELDLVLVLEEAGRSALPEPLAETAAIAVPILNELSDSAFAQNWLAKVTAGDAALSVGIEPWPYVTHAQTADLVFVQRGSELFALERGRAELVPQRSADGSRRLFALEFSSENALSVARGAQAQRISTAVRDCCAFAASAELIGLSARMLELSVEYAQTRQQFARPIGSFQAVQHRLADALVKLEFARPLVYRAAYSLAHCAPERSLHVSMAKVAASDAANFVSRTALQVHGAIGYSYEYHLHFFMKRAWALAAAWGDAAWHRERCAEQVLGPPVSQGVQHG